MSIIGATSSTFAAIRREEFSNSDCARFRSSEKNWKEFIAHRPAVKIEGIDLFSDQAVVSEWENGLQQIEIVNFKNNTRHRIAFPEPVYAVGLAANHEYKTTVVRYNYQSLTTPSSVFDYDLNTSKAMLLKQQEVPGGFDKANYKSERVFATAADGTKIPMSVVYRRNVKLDGSGAVAALRIRIVRHFHSADIFGGPSGFARSRSGLRDCAHSRRRRVG